MRRDAALEASVEIGAPPEVIWPLVSDLTRMGEWSPECTGARWKGGASGAQPGARFSGRNRKAFWRWSTKCTIVAAVPDREVAWTVSFFGLSVAYWGYRLEPSADGGTVVTEQWRDLRTFPVFQWAPAVKLVTGISDRVGTNESNMHATLDRLKAAAEQRSAYSHQTPRM
jgi:uncharacterized protein YndB with AHSA1/START domain